MAITEELRKAIADSKKKLSEIAEESGIPQPMLHRFVAGKDLRLATAEKLAIYFGLKLAVDKQKIRPTDTPAVNWGTTKGKRPKGRR